MASRHFRARCYAWQVPKHSDFIFEKINLLSFRMLTFIRMNSANLKRTLLQTWQTTCLYLHAQKRY